MYIKSNEWYIKFFAKEKRDRKEKELKELQVKIAGLIPYVVKNGADVLQVIQNAENKERTEMFFDIYEEENTQMLIAAKNRASRLSVAPFII